MLAMQYSFTLPADYDMSIIRQRIATKGHLMDGFPLLVFKAFLQASRDVGRRHAFENLYAPFYMLSDLQMAETESIALDVEEKGALGAVVGFDPALWTLVRFRLWPQYHEAFDREGLQAYDIGHLST